MGRHKRTFPSNLVRELEHRQDGDKQLPGLCFECSSIFQGQLQLWEEYRSDSNRQGDAACSKNPPYTVYSSTEIEVGQLLTRNCSLCFLRWRKLQWESFTPVQSFTTRYCVADDGDRSEGLSLRFSYSKVPSSETIFDSSQDVASQVFSLSPVPDGANLKVQPASRNSKRDVDTITIDKQGQSWYGPADHYIKHEKHRTCISREPVLYQYELWKQYQRLANVNQPSESTNSVFTWNIARLWIQNCIQNHPQCRVTQLPRRRLPTRLLALSKEPGIKSHIVDGSTLPITTEYTALSHCWGETSFLTLTAENMATLYQNVNIADLKETFSDAMEATIKLGYYYIWIDSLCIMQDRPNDWRLESERMGEYYSNAVCNLAASSASDGEGGCFVKRHPLAAQACIVREQWTNTAPQFTFYVHDSMREFLRAAVLCKLGQRGWIQQEVLLAPRVLYFGHDQVFWDCLGLRACEAYPVRWIGVSQLNKMGVFPFRMVESRDLFKARRLADVMQWQHMVENYSSCLLTYPQKDKLVALSGIAKRFGRSNDYLAGIWRDNLSELLLWRPEEGTELHAIYLAPSWSWASMDGSVKFQDCWDDHTVDKQSEIHHDDSKKELFIWRLRRSLRHFLAKSRLRRVPSITAGFISLVAAEVEAVGEDLTGQISNAFIRVKGYPFFIEKWPTDDSDLGTWADFVLSLTVDDKTATESSTAGFYCYLPIRITNNYNLHGLLLRPTDQRPGEYRRAGLFAVSSKIPTKLPFESLGVIQAVLGQRCKPLPSERYEAKTGRSRDGLTECIISII